MRQLTLAAAVVAASLSASVSASPYSDIYVFGDSLFDTGNLGVRFTNKVGPDYNNSPYGPVSPDLVAVGLGMPRATPSADGGTNYAVGDNRSQQTLESITAETTYVAPAGPSFNSLFYNLERTGSSLDRQAIYLLDGGGNDIRSLTPPEVTATNMVAAANALTERGAKYVVITNVPDFGLAPAGIAFSDYASGQAAAMNEQMLQQVGSSNILIFDAFSMLGEIAADPGAYGVGISAEAFSYSCFDSNAATCTEGNAAAKIDGSSPDPDQFMFNDPLHPTTVGQQITADYLLSVLKAPTEIALLAEMGVDDMQAHWRAAHPVMRSNRWNDRTEVGMYTVWGGLNAGEQERDTLFGDTGTNKQVQYDLGLIYRFSDSWYLGGMLSRADNELDFDDSDSSYDMESLDFSLLSGFRGDRWFLEAALSYSDLDYDDLKRSFNLGLLKRTERADTNGETQGAMVNAGYNLISPEKSYRLGPLAGYEYIRVELDGYTEKGSNATALVVDDEKVSTSVWSAGAFGEMQLGFCECVLHSEAVYQSYGLDGSINRKIGLVSQPGNSAVLPGYERDDDGWRWDAGLSARLSDAIEVNVGAGYGDSDNGDNFWYGGEVSYSF